MGELSFAQFITLQVICLLTSSMSVIGSSLIIVSIFRQQEQQKHLKNNTLHQLLLGLSITDIVATITTVAFVFAAPSITSTSENENPWAIGNRASCSASAFLYVLSATAANFYNMFMSIHFWRMVRTTKKRGGAISSQATKQKDWWFRFAAHCISIFVPFLFALVGIITNTYHALEYTGFCYYSEYPQGCDLDPNVECQDTTGRNLGRIRTGLMAMIAIISIAITIRLTVHVQSNLKKSAKYSPTRRQQQQQVQLSTCSGSSAYDSIASGHDGSYISSTGTTTSTQSKAKASRGRDKFDNKQRQVAVQALWYMLAYLNSFIILVICGIVVNVSDAALRPGDPGPYTLLLLLWISMPLQGFLNWVVFIRPRYQAWKTYYEKENQRQQQQQQQQQQQHHTDDNNNSNDNSDNPMMLVMPSFWLIMKNAILEQVPSSSAARQRTRTRRGGRRPNHPNFNNNKQSATATNNNGSSRGSTDPEQAMRISSIQMDDESSLLHCSSLDERSSTLLAVSSRVVPPTSILETICTTTATTGQDESSSKRNQDSMENLLLQEEEFQNEGVADGVNNGGVFQQEEEEDEQEDEGMLHDIDNDDDDSSSCSADLLTDDMVVSDTGCDDESFSGTEDEAGNNDIDHFVIESELVTVEPPTGKQDNDKSYREDVMVWSHDKMLSC